MGLEELGGSVDGTVVVVCGDTPLLTGETLRRLSETHVADGNAVTVLTAEMPDATGYGRIVRDGSGAVTAIVEHKDASDEVRAIREINSGVFAFDGALLADALKKVRTDNSQGEEYLTDVLGILREAGHRVGASVAGDHREIAGINNRVQLAEARRILNERLLTAAMLSGVTVVDPASTWVDVTVTFEQDVVVHPGTQLHGATHLAEGCEVGPNTRLTDTRVGAGARVDNTVSMGAEVGPEASVGPFAYLRPGTRLARKGKIGTYVETKNASIGEGTKIPHLSYVGMPRSASSRTSVRRVCSSITTDRTNITRRSGRTAGPGRTTCLWLLSRSATAPTRPRARSSRRMCRPVRWRWLAASSGTSRAGWRASVPGVLPRRPRRRRRRSGTARTDRRAFRPGRRTVIGADAHPHQLRNL